MTCWDWRTRENCCLPGGLVLGNFAIPGGFASLQLVAFELSLRALEVCKNTEEVAMLICNRVAFCLVLLCPCATNTPFASAETVGLVAQTGKLGLSPEDQKRYNEHMKSAGEHMSKGILGIRLAILAVASMFLKASYDVYRKGFKISAEKKIEGKAGRLIAIALGLLGITIAIGGWIAVPSLVA